MNANSKFLNHLRHSSELVKNWPAWKTGMWQNEHAETVRSQETRHFLAQQLLTQPRAGKK